MSTVIYSEPTPIPSFPIGVCHFGDVRPFCILIIKNLLISLTDMKLNQFDEKNKQLSMD